MNCKLCLKNLEKYLEGKLSPGMKTQVEEHLSQCAECSLFYDSSIIAEKVINMEKGLLSDHLVASRIMARVENSGERVKEEIVTIRALKPALITISAAAAIFLGVVIGSLLTGSQVIKKAPSELVFSNDAVIESVSLLATE